MTDFDWLTSPRVCDGYGAKGDICYNYWTSTLYIQIEKGAKLSKEGDPVSFSSMHVTKKMSHRKHEGLLN